MRTRETEYEFTFFHLLKNGEQENVPLDQSKLQMKSQTSHYRLCVSASMDNEVITTLCLNPGSALQ